MNNWKALGYIFLGFGVLAFIVAIIVGYTMANANPFPKSSTLYSQVGQALFMNSFAPYAVIGLCLFVIAGVGLYAGRNKVIESQEQASQDYTIQNKVPSYKTTSYETNESNLFERLNRLENIVDNNFDVITKRLDKIEEQQKLASQNTLIKAKQE
jgi:CHASE3 domain sensor protein